MRAIRIALFASVVAACGGGGEKKDIDALVIVPDAPPDAAPDAFEPQFDFSCMGNSQPAAQANVTLSGFAAEVVLAGLQPDVAPAHNATIDVCKASSTTCLMTDKLDTKMTPMNGCPATGCPFTTASLATMGAPLDVYAKVSKTGDRTTYIYPAAAVVANVTNIPAVMFSQAIIQALPLLDIMQDDGKGIMLIAVTDCASMPITDSTNLNLTIKQGGNDVQGTTVFNAGDLDPALAGTFAIFNVPTGDPQNPTAVHTEVGGTYKTKALRAHEVRVFPNGTTGTQLRPGF